jgi:hypothetical protein
MCCGTCRCTLKGLLMVQLHQQDLTKVVKSGTVAMASVLQAATGDSVQLSTDTLASTYCMLQLSLAFNSILRLSCRPLCFDCSTAGATRNKPLCVWAGDAAYHGPVTQAGAILCRQLSAALLTVLLVV